VNRHKEIALHVPSSTVSYTDFLQYYRNAVSLICFFCVIYSKVSSGQTKHLIILVPLQ